MSLNGASDVAPFLSACSVVEALKIMEAGETSKGLWLCCLRPLGSEHDRVGPSPCMSPAAGASRRICKRRGRAALSPLYTPCDGAPPARVQVCPRLTPSALPLGTKAREGIAHFSGLLETGRAPGISHRVVYIHMHGPQALPTASPGQDIM